MTQPSLDEAVREHYRTASLDPDALRSLREAVLDAAPEASAPVPPEASRLASRRAGGRAIASGAARLWRPIAAGALVVALAAALLLAWPAGGVSAEAVAQEIALNHVRALDPDVRAPSFADLAGDLEGLDFAVVRPASMEMGELVGARYCSLGGEMAAQIRFRDSNARICTLYQAKDSDTFRDVQEGTYERGGVRVRVWRESGLVMGLAEPIAGA